MEDAELVDITIRDVCHTLDRCEHSFADAEWQPAQELSSAAQPFISICSLSDQDSKLTMI